MSKKTVTVSSRVFPAASVATIEMRFEPSWIEIPFALKDVPVTSAGTESATTVTVTGVSSKTPPETEIVWILV